jgi:hypothetical protein
MQNIKNIPFVTVSAGKSDNGEGLIHGGKC